MDLKLNFDNPAIMLITFGCVSALILIVITYSINNAWSKILPELYAKTSKRVFAAIPLILGIPYWSFICYKIYSSFPQAYVFDIGFNIIIGILIGTVSTSMYEIVIQILLDKIKKI